MKLSFFRKISPYFINISIIILILFFSISFLKDAVLIKVPVGDIFQFISDGRTYAQWQLPEPIFIPPANPILNNILAGFLKQEYPEVIAAFLISTWSNIILLFLILFYLQRKIKHKFLLIPFFILLVTNPVAIRTMLTGNSNALFGLLAFVNLIVYEKNKKIAYLLSAIFILVRYEAMALFGTFLLMDFYFSFSKNKKTDIKFCFKNLIKETWFKYAMIGLATIMSWFLFIILWNNHYDHHYGIYYAHEVLSRSESIPNLKYLLKFSNLFIGEDWWWDGQSALINSLLTQISFVTLFFAFLISFLKKNKVILSYIVFTVLYLLIHTFFPSASYRYFFPILIPVLICHFYVIDLFLSKFQNKQYGFLFKITILILIFSLSVSISKFNFRENEVNKEVMNNQHAEIKAVVEWIAKQEFSEKKYVTGFNMFPYFNKNSMVIYLEYFAACNSVRCVVDESGFEREEVLRNLWVVKTADSQILTEFKINEMGASVFNNELEESCLKEIHRIEIENIYEWEDERSATVYEYNYVECQELELGELY